MENILESCRRLWNIALADRKGAWEYKRLSTTYFQQCAMLTVEAKSDSALSGLYSQVGQGVLGRLDKAFKAFFEHKAGYPRFKKRSALGSFTYPRACNGSVKPDVTRKRLYLSKVGNVKTIFHRETPTARLKTCTVSKEPDGKWFASLVYEDVVPLQDVTIPESWKSPVGVDLGLKSIITTSDDEEIPPPKFLRKAERRLKRLQRNLSRKQKGSKNHMKTRQRVASLLAKVARQRADFNHKLSARLVRGTTSLLSRI